MSKYCIGTEEPDYDELSRYRLENQESCPRQIGDYWGVREYDLNRSQEDNDAIDNRILTAYNSPKESVYVDRKIFVTEDADLFCLLFDKVELDFVHDFKTGLFFIDMFAHHDLLMGQLYRLAKPRVYQNVPDEERGEQYVSEGLGMFMSSQSSTVFIGEDVAVPDFFRKWKHRLERL